MHVLETAQMNFMAMSEKLVARMKDEVPDKVNDIMEDAHRSEKLQKLHELFAEYMTSGDMSTAKLTLSHACDHITKTANLLQDRLKSGIAKTRQLLQECSILALGQGPDDEYLLDICSQNSDACVDTKDGVHVGCCCGFNPLMYLGAGVHHSRANDRGVKRLWAEFTRRQWSCRRLRCIACQRCMWRSLGCIAREGRSDQGRFRRQQRVGTV
eukprot:SRR837773.16416.p1 GENE.SRR837773.16416~~SRR837773.16416.p1  ORF type:complete len:212 (-),score=0.66 SRR837773.16416:177-812(-)